MFFSSIDANGFRRAPTRTWRIAAVAFALSAACVSAFAQPAQPAPSGDEIAFLDRAGLAGFEVRYITPDGETLTYSEFERRIAGGKTFEMLKQTGEKKRATVVLGTIAEMMAAAPPTTTSTEAEFRDAMGLVGYEVRYEGPDGAALTYAQFEALAAVGNSFDTTKQTTGTKSAVVRVSGKTADVAIPAYANTPAQPMPAFALSALDGTALTHASLTGKPTLINFFFADCAPCIAEIPALNAFASAQPSVRTLGVTFDEESEARTFVAKRKFDWTILPDAKPLIDALGIRSYPSFALVDANGVVRALASSHEISGDEKTPMSPALLTAWIDRALDPAKVD